MLIGKFLETGAQANEITLYITCQAVTAKALIDNFQSSVYCVVCNPQADLMLPNAVNTFKLKGVENLTDMDIALTKLLRSINPSAACQKRACIDLLSDVLLQQHSVITRKWLSSLLLTLKQKGFTTLAVIDPQMHPQEEMQAILSLFDGEIQLMEKETQNGSRKILKVKRLHGKEYLENELEVTKEKLRE